MSFDHVVDSLLGEEGELKEVDCGGEKRMVA